MSGNTSLDTLRTSWVIEGVNPRLRSSGSQPGMARTPVPAHLFVAAIRGADLLVMAACGVLASEAGFALGVEGDAGERVLTALAAVLASSFALNNTGAYAPSRLRNLRHRLRSVGTAVLAGGAASFACLALLPLDARPSLAWPLLWMLAAGVLMSGTASVSARLARSLANAERLGRRVAVVGVNAFSRAFIARVAADPDQAVTFAGLYDDGAEPVEADADHPVLGQLEDLVSRSRRERIDAIVLALPLSDANRIIRSRAAIRSVTADIYMAAEILDLTCPAGQVERLGSNAVIKIGSRPLDEWQMLQKGALDGLLSAFLLVAALPFLALVALAIRLDSPGPVLFRQPRLGFNNNMFDVFKFRTMYHHMTDLKADQQTTRGDPRITRIGRLLRKTSLDEVPQLLNVLRGEMSLVGPRPHAPNTKAGDQLFHDAVADYALRHRVKPGITGWAQVNGWRGETRTRLQLEQRVAHDLHYIDNWSMLLDLKIIALTALRELNSKVAF